MATTSGHAPTDRTAPRRPGPDDIAPGEGRDADPQDASIEDWVEADKARPTLPEETADGLDDMDEEIRHQAEDLPLDTPGRSE